VFNLDFKFAMVFLEWIFLEIQTCCIRLISEIAIQLMVKVYLDSSNTGNVIDLITIVWL
jgi:hypothetical protein